MNKRDCFIAQDLLPLYYDGVCSDESKNFVEEHLKECENCRVLLDNLKDETLEEEWHEETHDVLKRYMQKQRAKAVKAGVIIAGILLVPIIIAMIMLIPGYSDWETNAVLIASMLLVAGMTVVPLLASAKKLSKAIISSVIALLLLIFFVVMFFGEGGWLNYATIAFSVLFGLSLPFFPIIVKQADLPEFWKRHKGLLIIGWDTVFFYLMIGSFALMYPESRAELFILSSFFAVLVWGIFIIAKYVSVNRFIKSGLIIILIGLWTSIGTWKGWMTFYDLEPRTVPVISAIAGGILVIIGLATGRKRINANE